MIKLGTVGIISKAKLETTWIEILIHTGSIKPIVTDSTREVEIYILHTKMVCLIVELTFELFLSQLAERRNCCLLYTSMIQEDFSKYDLSSLEYCTTAGEAMNPSVAETFQKLTGVQIYEGFGQTETTMTLGTFPWIDVYKRQVWQ